ncbi:MAG: tetratricopeptide repeat protein, partial [Massilibacteroides sp.]|nr:tetratricopeptide repeat protein [Massilibacteroides sp.]MDD4661377.1 tetratricopeptide repeat protein [Massilibacteroides sp.]
GVTQDSTEAVNWYRKAAEQGLVEAQLNLGSCYYNGTGVTQDSTEAVNWYRKAAEQGNADAQFNLGVFYRYGIGVTQDSTEAVNWYRKAAEQGNADAQFNLGVFYHYGIGVTQDSTEAVNWYRKAVEQGDSKAQFALGVCYDDGMGVTQDSTEAVNWYRKAADQGSAVAQRNLGRCYYYGIGVTQDYTEAVNWYRKAAEQGDSLANVRLSDLYRNMDIKWLTRNAASGDSLAIVSLPNEYRSILPDKIDEALSLIKEIVQKHNTIDNQILVAICYNEKIQWEWLFGNYTNEDSLTYYGREFLTWISPAIAANNPEAILEMGRYYFNIRSAESRANINTDSIEYHSKESEKWLFKAIGIGKTEALYDLGRLYSDMHNFSEAIKYFAKSAELGDYFAIDRIADIYADNQNIMYDLSATIKLITEAAEQGNIKAMKSLARLCYSQNNEEEAFRWFEKIDKYFNRDHAFEMGERYYHGGSNWIVDQDYEKAVYWYSIAAESGNNEAITELAQCYRDGKGVKKDVNKALELFKKAASNGYELAYGWIGSLYDYGDLGPNYEEALKWYKKAVELGANYYAREVTEMENKINGVEQNEKEFLERIRSGEEFGGNFGFAYKAALAGDPTGQALLGEFYYIGFRVKQNFPEAIKWFTTVLQNADNSTSSIMKKNAYASAQYNIGRCYYFGHGLEQSYEKAFECFKKAAEEGYPQAQNNVAMCYYQGIGVIRDVTEAKKWIQKAVDQNLDEAKENLKLIESGNSELKFVDFGEAKITF